MNPLKWFRTAAQWFADFKQNSADYAYFVHAFIACDVVLILHYRLHLALWLAAVIMGAIAGGLEYWFDARFEKNPPQSFGQNTFDFVSYLAGIALAVLVVVI